ncbi:putative tRNA adenosine deaminase-associated protein [Motilibacter peucedani]|uniref:Putative tRNA adenosine deaminase-associated protein n=1 Tax=Motilibacter peucedani TaxID=598650 RepID=A0A420XQB7_9ACTN|nr:tRNA adenosine deaminase-associated protein [Motilibacter peucedani]RKS75445.1 putative tRNA adenosine deaminase-associated protein [Motilibacter peucedani]
MPRTQTTADGRDAAWDDDAGEGDFAVAAYREDGVWHVSRLAGNAHDDLSALVRALQQRPPESAPLAFVGVDDDFYVAARLVGRDVRLLLSDVTAASEWPLAREVLDTLGEELPDDDEPRPVGDLGMFADLGLPRRVVEGMCDDDELYPDEACVELADRLGFGPQLEFALRRLAAR